ncbi:MAG: coproporphyrinogen dehydrogenase HemZ [Defluviitaleaceae bacterium]|nr:coproporphyrinogen dehydrogenase HemZ [Defluviitaleaceae bacterium]
MKFLAEDNETGCISRHDVQTMAQVFIQHEGYQIVKTIPDEGLVLRVFPENENITAVLYENGIPIFKSTCCDAFAAKRAVYNVLAEHTGYTPDWGLLTGIRPTKIVHQLLNSGKSPQEASDILKELYLVSKSKSELCVDVACNQRKILSKTPETAKNSAEAVSVYVAIPFCPSRCYYCSFASYPIEKFGKYASQYVEALIIELTAVSKMCNERNMYVESIYIGGGTPTALNTRELSILLEAISRLFDISATKEFTVEAGRPDTINFENLKLMKHYGVNRISVNPQTLNDTTLAKIGRNHNSDDFYRAWNAAISVGFKNINADLILGLTGETPDDISNTLTSLLKLSPASVTIHTLAVKRASKLKENAESIAQDNLLEKAREMQNMINITIYHLTAAGQMPYYLYRQKNSLGNFENVGWCLPEYHGLYNIQIMEERQSIFAVGVGAVTKIINPKKNLIKRAFNFRDLAGYLLCVDEMILRKQQLLEEMAK